jgi:hypothetical protein
MDQPAFCFRSPAICSAELMIVGLLVTRWVSKGQQGDTEVGYSDKEGN